MAEVLVQESSLQNIADAIRVKNGLTTEYLPSEMAAAILAITATIADKVPAEYASLAVTAEGLVTAQGGTYQSVMILEDDTYIAFGFLTSGFAIQSYNTQTTEYTANGFWYVQYVKATEAMTLYDYTSTTSVGDSFFKNGVFTNEVIEYGGEKVFPDGYVEQAVPIDISTDAGMTAVLTADNVGKCFRFTGTTGTYTNGNLYVVEASS